MRNRFVVALFVLAGVPGASAATALATDGQTGGAPAGSSEKTSPSHHKKVKLPKIMREIAKCESGDNPRAVSPDGRYRGKWQFTRATWRSLGGHGDPAKAPEWRQDKLALKLYHEEGTKPWPACSRWAREQG